MKHGPSKTARHGALQSGYYYVSINMYGRKGSMLAMYSDNTIIKTLHVVFDFFNMTMIKHRFLAGGPRPIRRTVREETLILGEAQRLKTFFRAERGPFLVFIVIP